MSDQQSIRRFLKFRNMMKSVYFALAIFLGLILGICSEMLAGLAYDSSHYIIWFISSVYITLAPVFVMVLIFYLAKLMMENLGIILIFERAMYRYRGIGDSYEAFLNDREKILLTKKLKEGSTHSLKWLVRTVLFIIGTLTCIPFFMASAMTVATMHAPAIIAYNVLIIGTIFPLIIIMLLCEATITVITRAKKSMVKVKARNQDLG